MPPVIMCKIYLQYSLLRLHLFFRINQSRACDVLIPGLQKPMRHTSVLLSKQPVLFEIVFVRVRYILK